MLFEDGGPIAIHSGSETRYLKSLAPADEWEVRTLMIRRLQAGGFVDQTMRAQ